MPILPAFIGGIATGVNANAAMEKQAALDLKTKTAVARATAGLTAAEENQIFKTGVTHHMFGRNLEDVYKDHFTHSKFKDIKGEKNQNLALLNANVKILTTPIPGLTIDQGEFKDKDLNVLQYAKATGQQDKIENMVRPFIGHVKRHLENTTTTSDGKVFMEPENAMPFTTDNKFIKQVWSNMWYKTDNYLNKATMNVISAPDFRGAELQPNGNVEIKINSIDTESMNSYHTDNKFAKMYRVDPMKLANMFSLRFHNGELSAEEFIVQEVLQGKERFNPMVDRTKLTKEDRTRLDYQTKFEIQSDIAGVFTNTQKTKLTNRDVLDRNKIMFLSQYFQNLRKKGMDISGLDIIDIIGSFYEKDRIVKGNGETLGKLGYEKEQKLDKLFETIQTDIANIQKPNRRLDKMLLTFDALEQVNRQLPMGGLGGLVITTRGILSTVEQLPEAKDAVGQFMSLHESRPPMDDSLREKFNFMKSRFETTEGYRKYTQAIQDDYKLMYSREQSLYKHINNKYSGNADRFQEAVRNGADDRGANLLRNTAVATMRFHSYLLAFDLAAAIQGGGDSRTISDKDVGLMQQAIMWRFFTSNMDFKAVLGEVKQLNLVMCLL